MEYLSATKTPLAASLDRLNALDSVEPQQSSSPVCRIIFEAKFELAPSGSTAEGPALHVECLLDDLAVEMLPRAFLKQCRKEFKKSVAVPIRARLIEAMQLDHGDNGPHSAGGIKSYPSISAHQPASNSPVINPKQATPNQGGVNDSHHVRTAVDTHVSVPPSGPPYPPNREPDSPKKKVRRNTEDLWKALGDLTLSPVEEEDLLVCEANFFEKTFSAGSSSIAVVQRNDTTIAATVSVPPISAPVGMTTPRPPTRQKRSPDTSQGQPIFSYRKKKPTRHAVALPMNATPHLSTPTPPSRTAPATVAPDLNGGPRLAAAAVASLAAFPARADVTMPHVQTPSTGLHAERVPYTLAHTAPAPSLHASVSTTPTPTQPLEIALPRIILDLLDRANAGPLVPREVSRCLLCLPGYDPGSWEFILGQCGLSKMNIKILVNVMDGMMVVTSPTKKKHLVRPKLSALQKAARLEKRQKLTADVAQARDELLGKVKDIADGNARSATWVKKQLFVAATTAKRGPNAWNGFAKGQLNQYNSKRPVGTRVTLPEFLVTDEGKAVKAEWDSMPEDEKEMYREEIEALRNKRQAIVRQNPQATLLDVNHTFKAMDNEWTAIENRTGGEGIYFFVRPSLEQVHAPKVHYTPAVENFFKDTLNIDPEELALRMESYLVGGCPKVKRSPTYALTGIISACRSHIQDNLDHIAQQEKIAKHIQMNYDNYERKIVEAHGLELVGWPEGKVRNPAKLGGRGPATRLLAALRNKSCHWVKLDPEAWEDRVAQNKARAAQGESIYKPRKKSTQSRSSAFKSRDTIDEDVDEAMDNGVEGDD